MSNLAYQLPVQPVTLACASSCAAYEPDFCPDCPDYQLQQLKERWQYLQKPHKVKLRTGVPSLVWDISFLYDMI